MRIEIGGGLRGRAASHFCLQVQGRKRDLRLAGISLFESLILAFARVLRCLFATFNLFFRMGSTIEANCRSPMIFSNSLRDAVRCFKKPPRIFRIGSLLSFGKDTVFVLVDQRSPSQVKFLAGIKRDFLRFTMNPLFFRIVSACWPAWNSPPLSKRSKADRPGRGE